MWQHVVHGADRADGSDGHDRDVGPADAPVPGNMIRNAWMGGFGWMWIPTLVASGFCVLVVWGLFVKQP